MRCPSTGCKVWHIARLHALDADQHGIDTSGLTSELQNGPALGDEIWAEGVAYLAPLLAHNLGIPFHLRPFLQESDWDTSPNTVDSYESAMERVQQGRAEGIDLVIIEPYCTQPGVMGTRTVRQPGERLLKMEF